MNDDAIADLKQFILATVSQATADMATKSDLQKLATKDDLKHLEQKVDDGFAGIAESLNIANEVTDSQLKDHEVRITKLEQNLA